MSKRNNFDEIMGGVEALKQEREGKLTLKRVQIEEMPEPTFSPESIKALREDRNLSRALFAKMIRTKPRTVESWEQGRSKPNTQAILIMKLVEEFPDTLQRLRSI